MILYRVGPGKWLTLQLFLFGTVSTFQAFQKGLGAYLTTRFLLGITESGFIPGGLRARPGTPVKSLPSVSLSFNSAASWVRLRPSWLLMVSFTCVKSQASLVSSGCSCSWAASLSSRASSTASSSLTRSRTPTGERTSTSAAIYQSLTTLAF